MNKWSWQIQMGVSLCELSKTYFDYGRQWSLIFWAWGFLSIAVSPSCSKIYTALKSKASTIWQTALVWFRPMAARRSHWQRHYTWTRACMDRDWEKMNYSIPEEQVQDEMIRKTYAYGVQATKNSTTMSIIVMVIFLSIFCFLDRLSTCCAWFTLNLPMFLILKIVNKF